MKQSKMLAAEEARDSTTKMPDIDADVDKFIQEKNGFYEIEPIECVGDYVAIAPFRRSEMTVGGIVVPKHADDRPNTGLVVGVGDIGNLSPGQHVKFIAKHKAADLTGEFLFYENAEIAVYKVASIVAILPLLKVRMPNAKV